MAQLRDAMALLLPFPNDAIPYLNEAGVNWTSITLNGINPVSMWNNIIQFTNLNNELDYLVEVLKLKFPKNPYLIAFSQDIDYSLGPDVKDADWKDGAADAIEKITSEKSTLLPIRFLEIGLKRARCVARIYIKRGASAEAGTGFLLNNNLLLTNNHVIQDVSTAVIAQVQFDYEESAEGLAVPVTGFMLDPDNGFATSIDNDWTVVRIKGDANSIYGFIDLKPVIVEKDDFVNIIQHPGGGYKQIGMYHNVVTFSNDHIVQYLTDTEPGSSGAPVFNSDWEVVALHHSGGMLREPGTAQKFLRNEGININVVIKGIRDHNL